MSLPKLIHAEFFREPLPPDPSRTSASDGGGDPLSGTSDAEISHIQAEPENQSSTAGPFHRFSNATAAVNRQAAALPRLSAGGTGDGSSDGRLTGGGDGESENAGEQTGISHASGISVESTVNCEPGIYVHYQHDENRTKWEEAALYIQEGEDNHKFYNHPTGKWSKIAYKILHHPGYHVFHLALSVLLMALALIEEPAVIENRVITVHGTLEILFLCLLGMDIILKLIWLTPEYFIQHRRTMFITVLLLVMFVEALAVLIRQKSHLRVTRSLRPVFFIDTYLMYGVRRVLRQIFKLLKPIVDVLLLLFFIIALFALIASYFLAKADKTYFASFGHSFVSLFITSTTANNPDVMMEAYSREKASPLFFVIYIVVTVYFISNILLAVVYSNFAEEEKEKFRQLFLHKREALRHAFRILTCSKGLTFYDFFKFMQHYKPHLPEWQVMCVFKAMHTKSNKQHTELSEEGFYDFYEVQNLKWREVTAEGEDVPWFQDFPQPVKKVFLKINTLVKWKWFNSIIYLVVLANTVFLILYTAFITESDTDEPSKWLKIVIPVSSLFLITYTGEIFLRILALGPFDFFRKFWNLCDFLIVVLSVIALCLEVDHHHLSALRPIKLIRLLRLKKRYRDIMNTLVVLIPRLTCVIILLLIIYYFFAIVGMEVFEEKVYEGCCSNASYGVYTYYNGSLNGTDSNVYYLINFDDLLRSYVTLFTLMVVNNWFIIMEGFASEVKHNWPARVFFISFYIVTLVVLQVVIAYIVEAFVLQLEQSTHMKQKMKKIIERPITVVDDSDSIEDAYRKKEVQIMLVSKDIAELKSTYIDECSKTDKFSFNRLLRRIRRKMFPNDRSLQYSGRRLRTKDDLHMWNYRADIQQWKQELEVAFKQAESSVKSTPSPSFKERFWQSAEKVLTYLLE